MAQQEIAGFRRSHKRIPTSVALKDDQEEMLAKQAAMGRMGQTGAAKAAQTGPKKSLSSYQGVNTVGRRESGPVGQPPLPGQPEDRMRRDAIVAAQGGFNQGVPGSTTLPGMNVIPDMSTAQGTVRTATGGVATPAVLPAAPSQQDPGDPFGLRESLQETYDRLNDQEAAEERIARARAAQSAAVRAAMGAGETGMSGAAALLEGDAGRMAESQARAAELAQDLEVAALGSALLGFDVTKDRYDKAEKAQAATAVMHTMMVYDISYDEAFELLGLPESAKSDENRETVERWRKGLDADAAEAEEEEEVSAEELDLNDFNSLLGFADDSEHVYELGDSGQEIVINTSIAGVSVPDGFQPIMLMSGQPATFNIGDPAQPHYAYKDSQGRYIYVRADRSGQPLA